MKLAIKELLYSKKKYLLVELIVVLMLFMVLFLSGLANGLGRAVSSAVENLDAEYFLLSDDSEELLTVSSLDKDILEEIQGMTESNVAVLDVQRMYIEQEDPSEKLGIIYFAIEPESFLNPDLCEGVGLAESDAENPIILDSDFREEGIALGDTIKDSSSGICFTVAGFSEDQMYSHVSAGFITTESYTKLCSNLNPYYVEKIHAIAIQGSDVSGIHIADTELLDKETLIKNLPSYQAEQTTIHMIVWVLVFVSAVIIGVFYYILTLQKEKQFGVMKAIGVTMGRLCRTLCAEVLLLAVLGALFANLFAFAIAAMLPETMPFYLTAAAAGLDTAAFILVSLMAGLLSVRKVAKVDPLLVIGGGDE